MELVNFILNKQNENTFLKVYEKSSKFIFQGFLALDTELNFFKRV